MYMVELTGQSGTLSKNYINQNVRQTCQFCAWSGQLRLKSTNNADVKVWQTEGVNRLHTGGRLAINNSYLQK